jgi:PST family polysaccharide transporter
VNPLSACYIPASVDSPQRAPVAPPGPSLRRALAPLAAGHALGLLVPLLTVPYLARVLQPEGWAPVLMAQALVAWIGLLLEYGADLSGARAVAAARSGSGGTLPATVWGVIGARLLLLPVALLVAGAFLLTVAPFHGAPALGVATVVAAAARGLSPMWYYLGIQRVAGAVGLETGVRVVGALGALPFVHGPADGWLVLAVPAVLGALTTVLLFVRLHREVPPPAQWFRAAWPSLVAGRTVFAYRLAGTLYVHANPLLLGAVAPASTIAAFGGAERIVRAATGLLEPLARATLPHLTALHRDDPARAAVLMRRLLLLSVGAAALGATGLIVTAPVLVRLLLGPGYDAAVPLLRGLALLLPIVATGTVVGFGWAFPQGRDRTVLGATATAGALALLAVLLLVPRTGAPGMVAVAVGAELLVAGVLLIAYRRRAP